MSRARRWAIGTGALAVAVGVLLPVAADWLVTRDGSRVETAGPWRVESRLVIFKRPDGSLGSLRLSEVDLDASRRLTEEMAAREAASEPEEAPKRDRPATIRLTERDLPPVDRAPEAQGSGEEPAATPQPEPSALDIVSFREVSNADSTGVAFSGTVQNRSEYTAVGVGVTAVLYDEQGEVIRRGTARLTASALGTGQSAGFRVDFPGVYQYVRVEFEVAGELLRTGTSDEAAGRSRETPTKPPSPRR